MSPRKTGFLESKNDSVKKEITAKAFDAERCMRVAALLKSLSHPQRLHIFCCLSQGETTVSGLQEFCGMPQATLSQHLTRLRLERVVQARREGNFVYYRLADPRIAELLQVLKRISDE